MSSSVVHVAHSPTASAANQTLKVQHQCRLKQQRDRSTVPTWFATQEAPLDDVDNESLNGNETDSPGETLAPDNSQRKQPRNGMSGSVRTPPACQQSWLYRHN